MWAAVNRQEVFTKGTWGAGPLARLPNGDYVVLSRAPLRNAPVVVIRASGRVTLGRADLELVHNSTAMRVSNVQAP